MGSTIDFVLGNGIGDEELPVPNVIGKRYSDVQSLLKELHLNLTPVIDADVVDTPNAYVYRQNPTKYAPAPDGEKRYNRIKPGQSMDIYVGVKPIRADSTDIQPEP